MNQVSFGSHDFANITSGRKNCDGSLFMQNVARKSEKRFLNKKGKPMYGILAVGIDFDKYFFGLNPSSADKRPLCSVPFFMNHGVKDFFPSRFKYMR